MKRKNILSIFLCVMMVAAVFATVAVVKNVVAEESIIERNIEDFNEKTDSTLTVINLERDVNQVDGTAYASITIYPIETDSQMTDEEKSDAMVIDIAFVLLMIVAILGIGLVYIKLKKRGNKFERILSIGLMFVLIATFFAMSVPMIVSATDPYPGTSNHYADIGNQTPVIPYDEPWKAANNIQDAIDVAWDGDTVHVAEGTYYENLIINNSLNLQGVHKDLTTIDGGGVGDVIEITADNVNVSNFTITYAQYGFWLRSDNNSIFDNIILNNLVGMCPDGSNGNSITNNTISNNIYFGVYLYSSSGNNITGNTIINNGYDGIYLDISNGNDIIDNNLSPNYRYGVQIVYSNNNNIVGNNVSNQISSGICVKFSNENYLSNNNASSNHDHGIHLIESSETTLTGNIMIDDSIFIDGSMMGHWNTHTIDTSNTVNGKPVYYWKDQTGGVIPSGAGEVILANCTGVTIENQDITSGSVGIELGFSSYNDITNNNVSSHSWYGIYDYKSDYNNIFVNTILDNKEGIYLESSSYNNIIGNDASYNNQAGIHLYYSTGNILEQNDISNNEMGVYALYSGESNIYFNNIFQNYHSGITINGSSNSNIIGNNITSNKHWYGIYIGSESMYLTNNTMTGVGIMIDGMGIAYWNTHTIDTTNTINGKPVYYWKDQTGGTIPPGAGQVILANCSNINIESQELTNGSVGILLGYSSNNNIINNNVSDGHEGIRIIYYSCENNIIGNNGSNIYYYGFYIFYSDGNYITNNTITWCNYIGIYINHSTDNIVTNNNFSNGYHGIHVCGDYNNIIGNNISSNNMKGIYLWISSNNNIAGNNILNNGDGIFLHNSLNNSIYHNNIINNANQAFDDKAANFWDNGYPSGGNYWDDFDQPSEGAFDDYKGPDQLTPGSDGIVDKGSTQGGGKNPYVIDSDSQDNYPFINENGWLDLLWRRWYVDMMDVLFPTHVVTANINDAPAGAGDDVVASCFHINTAYGAVVWYDNLGAPSFSNRIYIDDNIRMLGGIAVGDLDNDGDNDVVAVGDESYVYWYENLGSGSFSGRNILDNTLWDPKEVFIADINGDTLPDVVATGADGIQWLGRGQVKWYENLGQGNFVIGGRVIDNLPLAWGLYVADIDNDVDMDVVATSVGESGILDDGMIVWYKNDDGLGTFTGPNPIDNGRDGCENVFATYVDSDSYIDVVASMSDDNDYLLGWYKNDGLGGFSSLNQIDNNLEFNGLDIGDINYDGREDIAIATGSTDNWVIWYEKPSNPLIDPWIKRVIDDDPYPPPADARDVSITDLDKDVDLDVVGALFWKQAITWYENPLV